MEAAARVLGVKFQLLSARDPDTTDKGDAKKRFMVIVKANKESEAGVLRERKSSQNGQIQ
jgi:hypothetical protein